MPIEVRPYDPAWALTFEGLRHELASQLTGVEVLAIEHVGSTSVPGLAAKPVIDVDVVVTPTQVRPALDALVAAGYEELGTMGVPDRWALRAPGGPRRNVNVTIDGCLSLRNHRALRDVLRARPDLRDEYGDTKIRLAARFSPEEIDLYVAGKTAIVQRILALGGVTADELAEIAAINRRAERLDPLVDDN